MDHIFLLMLGEMLLVGGCGQLLWERVIDRHPLCSSSTRSSSSTLQVNHLLHVSLVVIQAYLMASWYVPIIGFCWGTQRSTSAPVNCWLHPFVSSSTIRCLPTSHQCSTSSYLLLVHPQTIIEDVFVGGVLWLRASFPFQVLNLSIHKVFPFIHSFRSLESICVIKRLNTMRCSWSY